MKLSTRERYAVMALADLALQTTVTPTAQNSQNPQNLSGISERQEISLAYLEQIFVALRRAGLVESKRGARGGYVLARAADEIKISEIIHAVDEPMDVTRCRNAGKCMHKHARCLTHDLWDNLGRQIESYLHSISLADVIGTTR